MRGRGSVGLNRRPNCELLNLRWASFSTTIPFSGIIRIRDMMYSVKDPFRLDQGDVSFDAPDTVKAAMRRAIDENRSHYLQTTGVPRLLELLAEKLRDAERHPGRQPRRGHGHDRRHPRRCSSSARRCSSPATRSSFRIPSGRRAPATSALAHGVPVPCPLHESLRLALRPRRARVEDHAEDARDLRQLAAQPDRRRADPRRHRGHRRARRASTTSGSSRTKPTRTSSSTAPSTSAPRRCPACTSGRFRSTRSARPTR